MQRVLIGLFAGLLSLLAASSASAQAVTFTHEASIYVGDKGLALRHPEGVACGADGAVVVADTGNGRLLRYEYKNQSFVGGTEVKLEQLPTPFRLQVDSKGNLLALDHKSRRIVRVTPQGAFDGFVEVGEKVVPGAFKLDGDGTLYVLDLAGGQVLVMAGGEVQRQVKLPAERGVVLDIQVDGKGNIYALDAVKSAVYLAPPRAESFTPFTKPLKEYVSFPTYMTMSPNGTLFLLDEHGSGVVLIGSDGTYRGRQLGMGWRDGLIYYPSQLCLTESRVAFVADRGNHRVQAFRMNR